MARFDSLKDKVVQLAVKPYSRAVEDEKYLKRNGYYLVEDEKFADGNWYNKKHLLKLKGINGFRDSAMFEVVPEAIIRELRIDSILKKSKKDIVITEPLGEREFDVVTDKSSVLIRLILKRLIDNDYKFNNLDEVINQVIINDILYALKLEDFEDVKDLSFNDLVVKGSVKSFKSIPLSSR